jgi:leucine-rich repeat protein SHOC2
MIPAELVEEAIATASRLHLSRLDLGNWNLTYLPDRSWHLLTDITELNLASNQLTTLPSGIVNLSNLVKLNLHNNPLIDLSILQKLPSLEVVELFNVNLPRRYWINFSNWQPQWLLDENNAEIRRVLIDQVGYEKICDKLNAITLDNWREYTLLKIDRVEPIFNLMLFDFNSETTLAERAEQAIATVSSLHLTRLDLRDWGLTSLPDSCWHLSEIIELDLENNKLVTLPDGIVNLSNLINLNLNDNPLTDLSILQALPNLENVKILHVNLPRRYWMNFSDWKPEWLLDEDNAEIRCILADRAASKKSYNKLNTIDNYLDLAVLEIDEVEPIYGHFANDEPKLARRLMTIDSPEATLHDREPMLLLKMTCPSTQHIHILRVPPEMTSAEAAITWVNHGIHPDKFAVQT